MERYRRRKCAPTPELDLRTAAYIEAILVIPVAIKMSILRTVPFGPNHVELSPVLAAFIAVAITTVIAFIVGLEITRQSGIADAIVMLAWLCIDVVELRSHLLKEDFTELHGIICVAML